MVLPDLVDECPVAEDGAICLCDGWKKAGIANTGFNLYMFLLHPGFVIDNLCSGFVP